MNRFVKLMVDAKFDQKRWSNCPVTEKCTDFIHGRGNILVANKTQKRLLEFWVWLFPVHARSTTRDERTRQMLQTFSKLQRLTDTSILICTRLISVPIRSQSNDNPFLNIIGLLNCQHSQRYLPVSATPAHPKVGAPEGNWEIVAICKGNKTQTFVVLRSVSSSNYWYTRIFIFGVILYS